MKHKMFAIFDAKALAYLPPFVLPEVGMAVRTFSDCVNSEEHQFGAHPEDYTLFIIGAYDDRTGLVGELDTRSVVHNGLELVKVVEDRVQPDLPFSEVERSANGPDVPAYLERIKEAVTPKDGS